MFKKIIIGAGATIVSAAVIWSSTAIVKNHYRSKANETITSDISKTLNRIADQLDSLTLIATFRADPWSGTMMEAYQDGWVDWVREQDPDIKLADMPNVKQIQRENAQDLIPYGFLSKEFENNREGL